jgi:hypothetical protein
MTFLVGVLKSASSIKMRIAAFAPTFELRPDRDPHWYKHFREQFENLWNGCGQRHFSGVEVHKLVEEVRNVSSN